MDAFAVSVAEGLRGRVFRLKNALLLGAYFGFFQFLMPLAGFFLAGTVREQVQRFGPWISFALLAFLGLRMVVGALRKGGAKEKPPADAALTHSRLFALAVATSIDALAVGVSFAFMSVRLLPACLLIGAVTALVCVLGNFLATRVHRVPVQASEILGGLVLVGIGLKLLLT